MNQPIVVVRLLAKLTNNQGKSPTGFTGIDDPYEAPSDCEVSRNHLLPQLFLPCLCTLKRCL